MAAMPTHPRLKLLPDGPFIEIDGDALFLGRDCHFASRIPALKNKVVSNRQCCVKHESSGQWTLEDLGSTNGTWLRNERLTHKVALVSGDVFSLGRAGPKLQCDLPMPVDPNATLKEDDLAAAETLLESPEGSAERPFKVGTTPQVTLRHEGTGHEFVAKGYTVIIGRDPKAAQVVIRSDDEKHVSGRHAEIQFHSDGAVVVRDLGSRNGTWLNDRPLIGDMPLQVGDRLLLGNKPTVLLVVKLEK
jgi:pSer/pThr/pTyr-binding forkhead associated (FHA) protein